MQRLLSVVAAVVAALALIGLGGCGGEVVADASQSALDTSAVPEELGDVETASDVGAPDADAGAPDADAGALDAIQDAGRIVPFFELGTNETGKNTPAFYSPLPEGGEVNVENGPQGLWMVVLAFKTRDLLAPPLFLSGEIVVDGIGAAGSLKLKGQKVFPGGDGFDYYYNFWLVVKTGNGGSPIGVGGQAATVTLEVTDANDHVQTVIRHVTLTGGPP